MNTLFPVNTPERCDELIRAARLRRVACEAARADWFSAHLSNFHPATTASPALVIAGHSAPVGREGGASSVISTGVREN